MGSCERFRAPLHTHPPFLSFSWRDTPPRHAGPHRAVPARWPRITLDTRHDPRITPRALHASHQGGAHQSPSPFGCHRRRCPLRGRVLTRQFGPSRHRVFRCSCLYGRLSAPGSLRGNTTSADFPSGCPVGVSPGKSALLPGATAAFTSAREPFDFVVLCQLVAAPPAFYAISVRLPVPGTADRSARWFPLAFLPPVGCPPGVGFA